MAETWRKCGHPRTPENTFWYKDARTTAGGYEGCRMCKNASFARWRQRNIERERARKRMENMNLTQYVKHRQRAWRYRAGQAVQQLEVIEAKLREVRNAVQA